MASAPRSVEILSPCAAKAMYDIETSIRRTRCLARGGPVKEGDAQWLPEFRCRNDGDGNRVRRDGIPGDHAHVFSDAAKLMGDLPRDVLYAALVRSEAFDDDRNTQGKSSCRVEWVGFARDDSLSLGFGFVTVRGRRSCEYLNRRRSEWVMPFARADTRGWRKCY